MFFFHIKYLFEYALTTVRALYIGFGVKGRYQQINQTGEEIDSSTTVLIEQRSGTDKNYSESAENKLLFPFVFPTQYEHDTADTEAYLGHFTKLHRAYETQ